MVKILEAFEVRLRLSGNCTEEHGISFFVVDWTTLYTADPVIDEPPPMEGAEILEVKKTVLVAVTIEDRLPRFDRISRFPIIKHAMA